MRRVGRSSAVVHALVAALGCMAPLSVARADHALALTPVGSAAPRIDGDLRDFRGVRFVEVGDDADGSFEYALGYDEQALYVGVRVFDDAFVRTRQPSPREDAVVLTLVMPRSSGAPIASEVWLFAGIPGEQPSVAAIGAVGERPSATRDVTIVEGPLAGQPRGQQGYVLEARIPLSAVPGGREAAVGRGAIRLQDVDGAPGNKPVSVASARARPAALPPLLFADGPNAQVQDFLQQKQLAPGSLRYDLIGQVAGDARLDRVVVVGTFVVVAGPGIEAHGGYHFMDLPVASAAGVLGAELRELTGDGQSELVLRLQQQNELGQRELMQVVALSPGQPRPLFSIELRKQTAAGSVSAELRFERSKPPTLEARIGRAEGLDASNYAEQPAAGVEPILLPWGKVAQRAYRWDGKAFAVLREVPNPNAQAPSSVAKDGGAQADDGLARVVHREPPGMDELVAAFREARGIDPALRPRFVQHANLAEDARIESLMLFGKDLLVIGKGYRGGSGYFYFSLPVADGAHVQRVFTADVTGDGRRELFVRHKQLIGDVQREILLVYTFTDAGMDPLAAIEVRRAQGERSVGNVVDIVPRGPHWALRISPGVAHGWSARHYPFVAESTDGYGPLLLPWKDRPQLYEVSAGRLVPTPAR